MKYKTRFLILLPVLLLVIFSIRAVVNSSSVILVEWDSEESKDRLFRSSHNADFFPLSNHFISQNNKIFCGLVSSAIILNALRLGKKENLPQDTQSISENDLVWLPENVNPFFGKYTPNNVLNDKVKKKIEVLGKPIKVNGDVKADYGLQLRQLAQTLRTHQLDVVIRVVNEKGNDE